MSEIPTELYYATSHEWARIEDDGTIAIGITDFAQEQLGDIVYVELPEIGEETTRGDEVAVVESVKAASDIYSPVSGEIVSINDQLEDQPELVNGSPYEDGWFFSVRPSDEGELENMLRADDYKAICEAEAE